MIRDLTITTITISIILCSLMPAARATNSIGILSSDLPADDSVDEYIWALRGGGVEVIKLRQSDLNNIREGIELIIVDDVALTRQAQRSIIEWVRAGGLLIVAGADAALQTRTSPTHLQIESDFVLGQILGARFGGWDPGLKGSYPYIIKHSSLISPLLPGNGLRLGQAGVDTDIIIESAGATVLAQSARLNPEVIPEGITAIPHPTILTHRAGLGSTVFLAMSLARVASCYSTSTGDPTDCSAASTARALMRWLTANLLWEKKGVQLPLYWEIPFEQPHGMLITGDVHNNDTSIRSARWVAQTMEAAGLPLSLYIVGRVGESFPNHLQAIRKMRNIDIEAHSADETVYASRKNNKKNRGPRGTQEVLADIRKARQLLGLSIKEFPDGWRTSIRSHGWQTDEDAWFAYHKAGVGLVLDQVSDCAINKNFFTPPLIWFRLPVANRLFIPLAERSIATAADDFILAHELRGNIFTIPTAQAEPCCNHKVTWEDYQEYVKNWHKIFHQFASMGGLAEAWLFHPDPIVLKGGLKSIVDYLSALQADPSIKFLQGHAFATWLSNRERISVKPILDDSGNLLELQLNTENDLLPLPPASPPNYRRIYYWVLGVASVPGWDAMSWKDPYGRTVTVLHTRMEPS